MKILGNTTPMWSKWDRLHCAEKSIGETNSMGIFENQPPHGIHFIIRSQCNLYVWFRQSEPADSYYFGNSVWVATQNVHRQYMYRRDNIMNLAFIRLAFLRLTANETTVIWFYMLIQHLTAILILYHLYLIFDFHLTYRGTLNL